MLVRLALVTAACALAGAGSAGPDVGWQSYENALRISASTGKAICLMFQNDMVDPKAGG